MPLNFKFCDLLTSLNPNNQIDRTKILFLFTKMFKSHLSHEIMLAITRLSEKPKQINSLTIFNLKNSYFLLLPTDLTNNILWPMLFTPPPTKASSSNENRSAQVKLPLNKIN